MEALRRETLQREQVSQTKALSEKAMKALFHPSSFFFLFFFLVHKSTLQRVVVGGGVGEFHVCNQSYGEESRAMQYSTYNSA